mgnify:CR=1 FL=1
MAGRLFVMNTNDYVLSVRCFVFKPPAQRGWITLLSQSHPLMRRKSGTPNHPASRQMMSRDLHHYPGHPPQGRKHSRKPCKHTYPFFHLLHFQAFVYNPKYLRLCLSFQCALCKIDLLFTVRTHVGSVKFIREYFFFLSASGTFAAKRFEMLEFRKSRTVLRCRHRILLAVMKLNR